jgi:hypothetical protein
VKDVRPDDIDSVALVIEMRCYVVTRDRSVIARTLEAFQNGEYDGSDSPRTGGRPRWCDGHLFIRIKRSAWKKVADGDGLGFAFVFDGAEARYGRAFVRDLDDFGRAIVEERYSELRKIAPHVRRVLVSDAPLRQQGAGPDRAPGNQGWTVPLMSIGDPDDVKRALSGMESIGGRGYEITAKLRRHVWITLVLDDGNQPCFDYALGPRYNLSAQRSYPYPFDEIAVRYR